MFLSFGKKTPTAKKTETKVEAFKTSASSWTSSGTGPAAPAVSRATVQTTAGPLLSSSRFNTTIDASTFANVNSPGFTSRVINYASSGCISPHENNASYHSKYSQVGLFPRVHLGGQTTLPVLSPRNSQKVGRTPVRVRIAPPALAERRRHSFSGLDVCKIKDSGDGLPRSPLCAQNLGKDLAIPVKPRDNNNLFAENSQEASRKRIFSDCPDAFDEAKKRRKKAEIPIPNPNNDNYQYRHVRAFAVPSGQTLLDNSSQGKRAREKGSPEEQKRQRRKICNTNNAIFSSLSSSRNLLERLSAQKRKSVDTSRPSSPLTPMSGKQIKENKLTKDDKVRCTSVGAPLAVSLEGEQQVIHTPISSKVIAARVNEVSKEKSVNECPSKLQKVLSTCDYTTKLFRKEVLSPALRTNVSKEKKQSMWIQPPEADEFSCSLLDTDSNLNRPERLRSLLARVSGKGDDCNVTAQSSIANERKIGTAQAPVTGSAGSNSTSPKIHFPYGSNLSSALTITVSSTSTIMTSSTVTSVNGVPSSESNNAPNVAVSSAANLKPTSLSSPLIASSLPSSSSFKAASDVITPSATHSVGSESSSLVVTDTSKSAPTLASSSSLTPASASGAYPRLDPKLATSEAAGDTAAVALSSNSNISIGGSQIACSGTLVSTSNTFSVKSPPNGLGAIPQSSSMKPFIQFGSNAFNPSKASDSTSQFGPNSSGPLSSTIQFGSRETPSTVAESVSVGTTTVSQTYQFGSASLKSSENSESALQTSAGLSNATAFISKSSATTPSSKPVSFGSLGNGHSEASKSTFQFGSSNGIISANPTASIQSAPGCKGSSDLSKSSLLTTSTNSTTAAASSTFSFGSSNNSSDPSKSGFQFGSNSSGFTGISNVSSSNTFSVAAKPLVSFGSSDKSSDASKSAFQFGSVSGGAIGSANISTSSNSTTAATKPSFSFGSGTNVGDAPKSAFQFGSNSGGAVGSANISTSSNSTTAATKPSFSFGSGTNVGDAPKSAFQFGSNSGSANISTTISSITTAEKPSFSFGLVSNGIDGLKSAFQCGSSGSKSFGSSAGGTSEVPKPAFQFAPVVNGMSDASKATFSFGSANTQAKASEQPLQIGSGLNKVPEPSKSAFQFSSNSVGKSACASASTSPSTFAAGSQDLTLKSSFGQIVQQPSFGQGSTQQSKGAFTFGSSLQSDSSLNSGNEGKGGFSFGSPVSSPFGSGPFSTTSAFTGQSALPSFGSLTGTSFGSGPSLSGQSTFSFNPSSTSGANSSLPFSQQNSAKSSNGSFSFGQTQDQAPSSFNFSATVTSVPNPNTQAQGLFSIGAGSTPTQRRIREVRRRR